MMTSGQRTSGTRPALRRRKKVDANMHLEMRRRRGRWIMTGLTATALLIAGCGGSSGSASGGGAATTSNAKAPTTPTKPVTLLRPLKPLKQPSARCGAPHTNATLVRFKAADGTPLDGVMAGSGTVGVVLAPEYASDLCGAWPFANYLAKRGFRAFAIDVRCFGRSACPQGDAAGRVVDDVAAAAAELRHRGVTKVALVGASMGGTAALIAATRKQPPIDAVISLSGEANPSSLLHLPLNARAAAEQLTVPAMFVVANLDQYTTVDETRAIDACHVPDGQERRQAPPRAARPVRWFPRLAGAHGGERTVLLNRHQSRGLHRRQHRRLTSTQLAAVFGVRSGC
jgi:pimeloyl-ACP methyl ester carboxylesterase